MRVRTRKAVLAAQAIMLGGLIAVGLMGCAAPAPIVQTRIQVERVTVPASLLSCTPEPAIDNITLQSQVADYIVRLQEAGADCRATVAAIAQIEAAPAP